MSKLDYVVCDDSEHNALLTPEYPRSAIILRAAFGDYWQDQHFLQNTGVVAKLWDEGKLDGGCVLYQPFIRPGTARSHYDYLWKLIGPKVPDWLTGIMPDEESWNGAPYAQHGDQSSQLNAYCGMNAHRMGSWKSVKGYANQSDFNALWRHRDARIDVILAAYTGRLMPHTVPHQVAQQITDGHYAPPRGYPSSTPPFGPSDHNVFFGIKNADEFRALWGRPPRVPKPVHRPPVHRKPVPVPSKTPAHVPSAVLGKSPSGAVTLHLHDDGGLTVHENGKFLYIVPRGK
jgi:hypothetical protein